ncbi:MAG: HAMP domain-containing protein [Deltaproteobacteria bacterium]|nr:HAMP domain-containing protein [Deltaproteobacteria bacterium]
MALGFRARLLAAFLGLVLVVELIAMLVLQRTLSADLVSRLDQRLERQAMGVTGWILEGGRHPQKLAPRLGRVVGARVTIFAPDGLVVGDSERSPEAAPAFEPGATPAEVVAARLGKVGRQSRRVDGVHMRFIAAPAENGMVVRLSVPLAEIDDALASLRRRLLLTSALAFLAALGLGLWAASRLARPLREMTAAAERMAQGDFRVALPARGRDEIGTLAGSLTSLATQLEARIGELTAEREHLRRLEQIRRDFVANVSHELRTPVAAMQGAAETLGARALAPAEQREFLAVIERHAHRLTHLVAELLSLAELEARRPGATPAEPVALAELGAEVARTVEPRAASRGSHVSIEIAADTRVLAHPAGLEQVLENLLDNALKYGRAGGTVTVSATSSAGRVVLTVADDGPGIAAEHLPRLFERFYRVDPGRSRELGGTGLGLAIVKHLCEAMGATVSVDSAPGQGARFNVSLPAAPTA